MPKYMNSEYAKCSLQLFADGKAGEDSGDDDGQDSDDEELDENGEGEPKYTKADLDKAVARTIAKERRKAERAAARVKPADKQPPIEDDKSEESEDAKARKEAENKASKMEVKIACFEADVARESVDDVAALAHSYMASDEDLDLEEAIEKVVKKYPHFKKGASGGEDEEEPTGKSWGQRQKGKAKKSSGVEEAFLKRNPGLKI